MIPLATLARTTETSGPNYILRFNLFPAAEITGSSGAGFSSGQTIEALKETFDGTVADGFGYDWSGQTFQEIRAQGQQGIVFAMAILFVFLLLAALYESWTLPFSVLLGTPFALLGAMFGTWALGLDNNLYTQIGIVLLIGLAAKNAILIVEFAKMGRDAGKPIDEAAAEAARLRFRPILMTAFAFILGCVPLMLASGSGANSRIALGTGVVFGMSCATVLGVFLIPFLYTVVQKFGERFSGHRRPPPRPSQSVEAPPCRSGFSRDYRCESATTVRRWVHARRHPRVGSDVQWKSPPRGCRRSRTRFETRGATSLSRCRGAASAATEASGRGCSRSYRGNSIVTAVA